MTFYSGYTTRKTGITKDIHWRKTSLATGRPIPIEGATVSILINTDENSHSVFLGPLLMNYVRRYTYCPPSTPLGRKFGTSISLTIPSRGFRFYSYTLLWYMVPKKDREIFALGWYVPPSIKLHKTVSGFLPPEVFWRRKIYRWCRTLWK